jgi:pyruvate dehydrogenase (quinone)
VTAAQAKHYMKALLHGDPDAAQIVMASAREVWDGLAAHAD